MNLNDTLHGYDESLAKVPSDMPGEIGAVISGKRRTNVVGRGGFVYVRLRTNLSEPIQAYNDKVFPGFGVAVIVRWVNNRYEIIGRDSQRYQEWETDTPEIAKHGSSHSLDVEGNNIGTDPVWVYPYQVIPGLVSPYSQSGVQNVYVHPFPILYGGEWMYVGNTGTASLTAYSPTSGTVLVLIAMDAETGNPALFASTGSYISWNISGSNSLVPNLPYLDTVRYLPLSFAILQSGTTSMSWSNLRDLRQWMSTSQSGTGCGASLEFQDEGVPLGIPGTVNFVGGNVSVTISGTVARVFVTGSSGGTSDHNSLTGLQGGTGSQYYHLGYNEWGGLVTGSLTYLHKHSALDLGTGTVATARLGSGTANATTFLRGDQTYANPNIIGQKRLSLQSNTPLPSTDQTAKTTIYWTDGYVNLSVSVPATTVTPFDVYYDISDNSLSTVNWTNDTTRATALANNADGLLCKSGDEDKLYLGTGRTTGVSGQCEDSQYKRFIENYYNKRLRVSNFLAGTTAHNYTTAAWREWNNGSGVTRFEFVTGAISALLLAGLGGAYSASGTTSGYLGVSINTVAGASHQFNAERSQGAITTYDAFSIPHALSSIGYHYATFVEYGSSSNFYFSTVQWKAGIYT